MKKKIYSLFIFILLVVSCYGLGRLYFQLTGGFTLANICSSFPFQPQWEVRSLSSEEQKEFEKAINQPYFYLGKGCQSYVFASQDGEYVIKFFKYQRYRVPPWLTYFPSLPAFVKYRQEKSEKKWKKLDGFVQSWKVAFENLKEESGLVAVHLNKTDHLQKQLVLYDKIGQKHLVDLDQMEFCIQHRARLICETLLDYKESNHFDEAKCLVHHLMELILSEYAKGLADNDHALMQNTGVAQGKPIHIDIGQFVFNEAVKNPEVFHQELVTKTYKFKLWLKEHYPEMATYLEEELSQIIGPAYPKIKPKFRQKANP